MKQIPKKFIVLVILNAVVIIVAAALLLRHFLWPATVIMPILFAVDFFIGPAALRSQNGEDFVPKQKLWRVWFLGFALLASAFVQLVVMVQEGFSWPGIAGVTGGLLVGTLFV